MTSIADFPGGVSSRATRAVQGLREALSQPVSPLSLAVFRMAVGAMLVWDCWRFIKYDRVYRY